MYSFYCIISEVENTYFVDFPDFKGSKCSCFTFGETLTEAVEMAEDVLYTCLDLLIDEKRDIPTPSLLKDILKLADEGNSIMKISVKVQ
ncbi:MAG: type II toxin-antitoxin system HicB family antitoxin [Rummeliibacillus sp.]